MSVRKVYFLRPVGAEGPVKIGSAEYPHLRLKQYGAWSPTPLEIVAEIEGGFRLERRFHARFLHLHTHSEWFRSDPELTETIGAIQAGTFDADSLPVGVHLPRRPRSDRCGAA